MLSEGFHDFSPGKPNVAKNKEACIELRSEFDYTWSDLDCKVSNLGFCEKISNVDQPLPPPDQNPDTEKIPDTEEMDPVRPSDPKGSGPNTSAKEFVFFFF